MKRLLSFILITSLLICSFIPVTGSVRAYSNATVIPDGWVGVWNESDLRAIENDLAGKYILMDDITITKLDSAPIIPCDGFKTFTEDGRYLGTGSFTGVFDGNGHVITFDAETEYAFNVDNIKVSIFGTNNGMVKNLTTDGHINVICNFDKGYEKAPTLNSGMVAFNAYGGIIENCVNRANVQISLRTLDSSKIISYTGGEIYISGITCYNQGTVRYCRNEGNIDVQLLFGS